MFFYIIRRLVAVVAMLFVISIATFLLFFAGPNDPARLTCAQELHARHGGGQPASLGLDKPIAVQYGAFLKGLFVERDFPDDPESEARPRSSSPSARPRAWATPSCDRPVSSIIADGLPITASLAVGAFVLWMVIGVPSA